MLPPAPARAPAAAPRGRAPLFIAPRPAGVTCCCPSPGPARPGRRGLPGAGGRRAAGPRQPCPGAAPGAGRPCPRRPTARRGAAPPEPGAAPHRAGEAAEQGGRARRPFVEARDPSFPPALPPCSHPPCRRQSPQGEARSGEAKPRGGQSCLELGLGPVRQADCPSPCRGLLVQHLGKPTRLH